MKKSLESFAEFTWTPSRSCQKPQRLHDSSCRTIPVFRFWNGSLWRKFAITLLFLATPLTARGATECLRNLEAANDFRGDAFAACVEELRARYAGNDREIPLEEKASFYAWQIRHYHRNPKHQVTPHVTLPTNSNEPVRHEYNADMSTWNGALLAALSYQYAVTQDRDTLIWISELISGLHFFLEITGVDGLAARCVLPGNTAVEDAALHYTDVDGTEYVYRSDPAKGTYNQIFSGYAAALTYVYDDLPLETQQILQRDILALAGYLVKNEYQIRGEDGKRTTYGNLRPTFLGVEVPFNAQVAYLIVATATQLPPQAEAPSNNSNLRADLIQAYAKIRQEHVYYENPWLHLALRPQRIGRSPFLDANDRNHLVTAAFMGLELELAAARAQARKPDPKFLYQLGQTLLWSTPVLRKQHNALANFMWVGMLADPQRFEVLVPKNQDHVRKEARFLLADGVEQLRRFPLDRFRWQGTTQEGKAAAWMDEYRPDSYAWKINPNLYFEKTGPRTNRLVAAIDYLHAYWIYRYFELDQPISTLHEQE